MKAPLFALWTRKGRQLTWTLSHVFSTEAAAILEKALIEKQPGIKAVVLPYKPQEVAER
jgi:hypothetical protein